MSELQTVKDIATVAAPLTSAIIETWIKPKLSKLLKRDRLTASLVEHSFASKLEKYLTSAYARHSYLNVLVLQNQQRLIGDLYVPLTLRGPKFESIQIEGYPDALIPKYRRVLITDTAGMGKSTITKYLFLRAIEENAGTPVIVELRKLSGQRSVIDLIFEELNPLEEEFDRDFLLSLVIRGDFIFFFDGYDEIAVSERTAVTDDLQSLIRKAPLNHYLLTSRPELGVAAFSDFQAFTVEPLEREEAYRLIRNYDADGQLSTELIAKLDDPVYSDIDEFLKNPFLVSLLFKAYDHKATIPLKKHLFYRQVYDALYEAHDLSKPGTFTRQKYSSLDIDDFDRVLRVLGYATFRRGQVEFSKDEFLSVLRECARELVDVKFKPYDFLRDVLVTVPLFTSEGNESLRWAHKSLQEYFAARFIIEDTKGKAPAILEKMYESVEGQRYFNVLDILYDLDPTTFRRVLIYRLLSDYSAWSEKTYVAEYSGVDETALLARKSVAFFLECFFVSEKYGALTSETLADELRKEGHLISGGTVLSFAQAKQGFIVAFPVPGYVVASVLLRRSSTLVFSTSSEDVSVVRASVEAADLLGGLPGLKFLNRSSILVTDDPSAVYNSSVFFETFTAALRHLCGFAIDTSICAGARQSIEAELARESENDDFLFAGL